MVSLPQAKESVFPVAEGGPAISYADGWYGMLKPLSPGSHTVHFSGSTPPSEVDPTGYANDVTYHLTVKRTPDLSSTLLSVMAKNV
jgi:hypothetical protein